jgi:hypothetical protein
MLACYASSMLSRISSTEKPIALAESSCSALQPTLQVRDPQIEARGRCRLCSPAIVSRIANPLVLKFAGISSLGLLAERTIAVQGVCRDRLQGCQSPVVSGVRLEVLLPK